MTAARTAARPRQRAGRDGLAGTGALIRLILRRDRFILPVWVLLLGLLPASFASAFRGLYPDEASRRLFADAMAGNPAMTAFYGPVYDSGIGALTMWRAGLNFVVIGLAALLTVVRHTRVEEETGRRELLGSTVVGRHAPLAAALTVTAAASALLGVLAAAGLAGQGLPVAGSIAAGAGFALTGLVFTGVGGVAAQLTEGAGGARAIGGAVLGLAYLLRMVGDSGEGLSWLRWLSPIGWVQQARPYAGERWAALLLPLACAVLLGWAAVALSRRRDVGAGLLPPRLGPATAAPSLRGPLALARRLHTRALVGWTAGFVVLGAAVGGAVQAAVDSLAGNAEVQEIIVRMGGGAQGLADAFLAAFMSILGLIVAAYAVQAALRARSEETALRAEPVLATATGRLRWLASHLVFALLGPAVVLAVTGLVIGLAYGSTTGGVGEQTGRALGAALLQLPAVWVLAGVATAGYGLAPRLTGLAWAAVAACFFLLYLGPILELPEWLTGLSPFAHLPKVTGGEVTIAPLAWLTGLAAALLAAGLAGFRRRDIG